MAEMQKPDVNMMPGEPKKSFGGLIGIIVIIIILVAGAIYFFSGKEAGAPVSPSDEVGALEQDLGVDTVGDQDLGLDELNSIETDLNAELEKTVQP